MKFVWQDKEPILYLSRLYGIGHFRRVPKLYFLSINGIFPLHFRLLVQQGSEHRSTAASAAAHFSISGVSEQNGPQGVRRLVVDVYGKVGHGKGLAAAEPGAQHADRAGRRGETKEAK